MQNTRKEGRQKKGHRASITRVTQFESRPPFSVSEISGDLIKARCCRSKPQNMQITIRGRRSDSENYHATLRDLLYRNKAMKVVDVVPFFSTPLRNNWHSRLESRSVQTDGTTFQSQQMWQKHCPKTSSPTLAFLGAKQTARRWSTL